jgi:hypothetical protein
MKNPAAGALVNYTQIVLNFQFHLKHYIDNKARFCYWGSYWFRLIGA